MRRGAPVGPVVGRIAGAVLMLQPIVPDERAAGLQSLQIVSHCERAAVGQCNVLARNARQGDTRVDVRSVPPSEFF